MAEAILLAIGVAVVAGVLAGRVLTTFRLPDVPLLLLAGLALGPGLGVLDGVEMRRVLPLAGTLAVVAILFEGGLAIRRDELFGSAGRGVVLAVFVFFLTAVVCAVAGLAFGLGLGPAVLLGMCLGGAGVMIVVPLAREMGASDKARTIVTVEAVVSDVLVVLGVVAVSTWLAGGDAGPAALGLLVGQQIVLGIAAGLAAGAAWAAILRALRPSHAYVLTLAVLFLAYAATEAVHGSGLLAVLAFGVVLANSKLPAFDPWRGARPDGGLLNREALGHQREAVFVLRSFFFVVLGAAIDVSLFASGTLIVAGLVLSVLVGLARITGVALVLPGAGLARDDRRTVALLFPLGLAAAALSLVPYGRFGVPGTEDLAAYATAAVLGTNLLAAAAVAVLGRREAPQPAPAAVARR